MQNEEKLINLLDEAVRILSDKEDLNSTKKFLWVLEDAWKDWQNIKPRLKENLKFRGSYPLEVLESTLDDIDESLTNINETLVKIADSLEKK